jgi:hypothetical protein
MTGLWRSKPSIAPNLLASPDFGRFSPFEHHTILRQRYAIFSTYIQSHRQILIIIDQNLTVLDFLDSRLTRTTLLSIIFNLEGRDIRSETCRQTQMVECI